MSKRSNKIIGKLLHSSKAYKWSELKRWSIISCKTSTKAKFLIIQLN